MGYELRKEASKYQVLFDLMHKEHNLILTRSEMDEIIKASQKVVKENELLHNVSGSFSSQDMENFAAKCMILGNDGKDTKQLLKEFCENDR